jgi:hypothetical protein
LRLSIDAGGLSLLFCGMATRQQQVGSMTAFAGTESRTLRIGLLVGAFCLGYGTAWAQMVPNSSITGPNSIAQKNNRTIMGQESKPEPPPPDAVPGAKARAPAAPAPKGAADMNPNEALFDAINRGDIGAARDALNRGADLHAQNILGMTPMELSVDLGRNDISFLLLSMRGEDSGGGAAPKAPPSAAQLVLEKAAAGPRPRAPRPAKPITVADKPVATPKLFANDGGTPLPNAGFLGFDPRSSTN